MKAITLYQPFASLMVIGAKNIETRSWNTNYRGPLLIHAGKKKDKQYKELCEHMHLPFRKYIDNYDNLPFGAVIGMVTLKDTMRFGTQRAIDYVKAQTVKDAKRLEEEIQFGDWQEGRYGFICNDAMKCKPVPCAGMLNMWDVPDEIISELRKYLPV